MRTSLWRWKKCSAGTTCAIKWMVMESYSVIIIPREWPISSLPQPRNQSCLSTWVNFNKYLTFGKQWTIGYSFHLDEWVWDIVKEEGEARKGVERRTIVSAQLNSTDSQTQPIHLSWFHLIMDSNGQYSEKEMEIKPKSPRNQPFRIPYSTLHYGKNWKQP